MSYEYKHLDSYVLQNIKAEIAAWAKEGWRLVSFNIAPPGSHEEWYYAIMEREVPCE